MYSFKTSVEGDLERVETRVVEALKNEGFGVLTEIDVQATMKMKLGIDKRPYKILGACNPSLANQAIDAEPDIGLLLPCNVVIRQEENGGITVAFMDPVAVLQLVEGEKIADMARDVKSRLERVRDAL
ncbi:MAG: DUF302 domain-containing protein [Candidatus Thiodiazotropha sp. (ex. Lucinisca nassula)]|nr:DUF302 domain-containing protein [Candidatus Thiodiazotropha sp. (ex. Lucinisca nassula)]MBW9273732.1 DUF302 domain-containing protein [Candidatus Thiodiazotropha sp. (ex. Lucinisca nassula)]PUB84973.1 MAG: hypothetical protein DBP01_14695 [gamma proteobacterium symbiont of Ctena orbiculata]PUB87115.1 MAG: hypothetical protein DBP02_01780 [gamma proteobacterium symbiont of Ctena orbiculata]